MKQPNPGQRLVSSSSRHRLILLAARLLYRHVFSAGTQRNKYPRRRPALPLLPLYIDWLTVVTLVYKWLIQSRSDKIHLRDNVTGTQKEQTLWCIIHCAAMQGFAVSEVLIDACKAFPGLVWMKETTAFLI